MSENNNLDRETIEVATLVRIQGEQIKSVLAQMQESSRVQAETNISLNRLTDEIAHMTKSHDTLARDTRDQFKSLQESMEKKKRDSNEKIDKISERVVTLEQENYASKGWKDTMASVKKTVIAAVVLAVLGLLGFNLK